MSKKQPNRLAQLIDHQAFAGSALPRTIADDMRLYVEATNEIKVLLGDCLPEEILNSCWVVGFTPEQLVLSVSSTTAANHIRYMQSSYIKVLTEQSITFRQLKQIRIIVAKSSIDKSSTNDSSVISTDLPNSLKANENQALSQNTKRTISQAAEHVTTDENLKKALLRLINH